MINRKLTRKLTRQVAHAVGQIGSGLLVGQLERLSFGAITRVAQSAARLAWNFSGRERARTLTHLRIAFPDRSSRWIARTGRLVFERLAICGAMTAHVGFNDTASMTQHLDLRELADWGAERDGRGEVIVATHIGPFFLQAAYYAGLVPLEVVVRQARASYVQKFEEELCARLGVSTIDQGVQMRRLIRLLKQGTSVALAADHDIRRLAGVFVPFFGKLAYTPIGPAALARLARSESLGVGVTLPTGRSTPSYVMRMERVVLQRTDDPEADLVENTRRWMTLVENYVRAYPEEWTWMNRRWRTRPADRPKATIWDPDKHQHTPWTPPPVRHP